MFNRWMMLLGLVKAVGWLSAFNIVTRRLLRVQAPVVVYARGHKIRVRPCDSDLFVASQVFGRQEYDLGAIEKSLNDLADSWTIAGVTPVIVDGGANVGYSAIFFSERFPQATIVSIEADLETFQELKANCSGNSRIVPVHGALWEHERGVNLGNPSRLGSWANRVEEGAGLTPSLLLSTVLALVPNSRTLVIKLDIEGAEAEVCRASSQSISDAPCILIEPHDFMLPGKGCLVSLYQAIAGRQVDTVISGENLVVYDSALASVQRM